MVRSGFSVTWKLEPPEQKTIGWRRRFTWLEEGESTVKDTTKEESCLWKKPCTRRVHGTRKKETSATLTTGRSDGSFGGNFEKVMVPIQDEDPRGSGVGQALGEEKQTDRSRLRGGKTAAVAKNKGDERKSC